MYRSDISAPPGLRRTGIYFVIRPTTTARIFGAMCCRIGLTPRLGITVG
jgi:hypothetical protein